MLRSGEVNFISDYTGDPQMLIDVAEQDGDLAIVDSRSTSASSSSASTPAGAIRRSRRSGARCPLP